MRKLKIDPYSRNNQLVVDAFIVASAFALAFVIRFEGIPPWRWTKQFLIWLPYLVVARLLVNWLLGVYRFIWRYVSLSDALAIGRSLLVVTSFLLALRLLYPGETNLAIRLRLPISVITLEYLLSLTGCLGARALRRTLYQRQANGAPGNGQKRRVVLIGAGHAGAAIAREAATTGDVQVVGFLDDDPKKIGTVINRIKVLGPTHLLPTVAKEHAIDEVMICIPKVPRAFLKRIWMICDQLAVQVKTVPTLEEVLSGKVNIAAFRDVQMTDLLGRETFDLSPNSAEISSAYRGKRILITGAGGSIGSELARQLLDLKPEQLVLLDKDENGLNDIYVLLTAKVRGRTVYPVVADIRFPERLHAIFSQFRPEVVFHAAAHKHVPLMEMNPPEAILNNVVGTLHLVEQSVESGVSQFVLISTDKAVKPSSIMGASKRVCEMIVQLHGNEGKTRFSCVRFGNVVGSRGSVIPLFQKQIAQGGPLTVTHPDIERFLMTIPEAVHLVIQAGTLGSNGEILVLDMGDPVPILELARDLAELSGLRPGQDIAIEMTQLRPGEKLQEELVDSATETLSSTRFEKIRVVTGQPLAPTRFWQQLAALEDAARRQSPREIRQILTDLGIGFSANESREYDSDSGASGKVARVRPAGE